MVRTVRRTLNEVGGAGQSEHEVFERGKLVEQRRQPGRREELQDLRRWWNGFFNDFPFPQQAQVNGLVRRGLDQERP